MNSRERTKLALDHQEPDRPPLLLWMVPEICERLKKHFNVATEEDVRDKLDIDVRWLLADYVGPELKVFPDGSRENVFGLRSKSVKNDFGCYDEFIFHPLAQAQTQHDLESYRWPDPDWWDYTSIQREITLADRVEPRWLGIGYASFFERAWELTGFEKLLFDMAVNPEFVETILNRLFDFYLEQTSRILKAADGRIDMIYIADDLGSQQGLLFSPDMYQQFLKGRWKSFIETVKDRFGEHLKFHFHSCGAVGKLIPHLIETGIDILNPIQPKAAGMEPQWLKDRFGSNLSFCGGLDIQDLLPHGSTEQVRAEAIRLAVVLGRNGGYIASPAHAVQSDTPIENILAMLEGFKEAHCG